MTREKLIEFQRNRVVYHQSIIALIGRIEPAKVYYVHLVSNLKYNSEDIEFIGRVKAFNTESIRFELLAAADPSKKNARWGKNIDNSREEYTLRFTYLLGYLKKAYGKAQLTLSEVTDPKDYVKYLTWPYVNPMLEKMFR